MKCSVCENKMVCPLCVDTGEQRYWEGRWRDERALNEGLMEAVQETRAVLYRERWGGILCNDDRELMDVLNAALARAKGKT